MERQMIISALTFAVCFSVIYGVYWTFVLRPETQAAGHVRGRLKKDHVRLVQRAQLLKQVQAMSAIGTVDAFLKRGKSHTHRYQTLIEQAGLKITVGTLFLGSAAVAALVFFVVQRLGAWSSIAAGAAARRTRTR